MKNLNTAQGIGTDPNFLNGDLVDGSTLLNTTVLQDIVQFFQKLKAKAGLTENGLFDNEVNGYQTIEALDKRNFTATIKTINLEFTNLVNLIFGANIDIPYPYGIDLDFARFTGIFSYQHQASGGGALTTNCIDINFISINSPLSVGFLVNSNPLVTLTFYNNRVNVHNVSTGDFFKYRLSVLIQGHVV